MTARSDRLRQAIDRLEQAARDDGIQADGMLGGWAAAQVDALNALYVMEEWREEQLGKLVEDAKAAAEGHAAQSEAEVRKLELTISRCKTAFAQAQSECIKGISDGVAAQVQGALVIRERAYNRTRWMGTSLAYAGALLATLLGGYGWSSRDHAASLEARLWARCKASVVIDGKGQVSCSPSPPIGAARP